MSQSKDFTSELSEQPHEVQTHNNDLQLRGVQVPPEAAPVPAPVEVLLPPPARKKRSKIGLLLLPILALAAGAYWMQSQRTSVETSATAPQIVAARKAVPVAAGKTKLKELWKQGALLKKHGDFAGARRLWQQGLKLDPTNVGFQQSLAKLPATQPAARGF